MHTISFRKIAKVTSSYPLSTRVSIYKNHPRSFHSTHPSLTLFNPAFVATARHSQEARINEPWLQARLSLRFAVQTVTLLYRMTYAPCRIRLWSSLETPFSPGREISRYKIEGIREPCIGKWW